MRVLVTGASGHIGRAVVADLLEGGHRVTGLARSESSAAELRAAGADVARGSLDDLDALRRAAAEAEGVIHLAYVHTPSPGDDPGALDVGAIEAMGDALQGSGKPFIGTSGTLVLTQGRTGTEEDPPDPAAPAANRIAGEQATLALRQRQVASAVVRLPPTVHSDLDHHGFVPTLIAIARRTGVSAFVDDGANRWPAVHTLDAARLFRLALEAATPGVRWHASSDEGVPFQAVAQVIGRQLDLPVVAVPAEEAADHFGWLAFAVRADNPTSSLLTRERVGWRPEHPLLLADLEEGHYFRV